MSVWKILNNPSHPWTAPTKEDVFAAHMILGRLKGLGENERAVFLATVITAASTDTMARIIVSVLAGAMGATQSAEKL